MYPPVLSICFRSLRLFAVMVLLLGVVNEGRGQDKKRTYANFQGTYETGINLLGLLTGNVSNDENAIDGNVTTFSSLSVPTGVVGLLSATQYLEFTANGSHASVRTISGNIPVTVKIQLPREVLGLLSGIEIGSFRNLAPVNAGLTNRAGYNTSNRTIAYSGSSLLNLLKGTGTFEITFTPGESYQGVFVRLSGNGLSVLLSSAVYHAYIYENHSYANCEEKNNPLDVLYGTRSEAIGLLTSIGGVTAPYNVINANNTDYATMNVGVGALNTIYLNTIFSTPSEPSQVVRIILEDPGALLDLGVLSSFSIQPYNREIAIGSPIVANGSLISARLLPGTHKYELAFKVNNPFDRVELRFDNTVTALTSLRIYEVSRLPRVLVIDDPTELATALTRCGSVDLIGAIANYQPDYYDYQYYTVSIGGSPLPSSAVTASGNYYIEAIDKITGCVSPRVVVTATVLPTPTITIPQLTTACQEDSQIHIVYSATTAAPITYSIDWNTEAESTGFMDIENSSHNFSPTGGTILINKPSAAIPGDYQGILIVKNASGCASENLNLTIKIQPKPPPPLLNINPHSQY